MLRDTYGSFWCGTGSGWFLYVIFVACICTLNVSPWMYLGIVREYNLEFLNPVLPIHNIYLAGLVDFLVMLGCLLLLQDHLHMLLSLLLLSMYEVYNHIFHGAAIVKVVREIF